MASSELQASLGMTAASRCSILRRECCSYDHCIHPQKSDEGVGSGAGDDTGTEREGAGHGQYRSRTACQHDAVMAVSRSMCS